MALHGHHTVSLNKRTPQQLFLGGFLKKIGKIAKTALPLVSLIPGVGTAVGLGAMALGQMIPGGKSKSGSADGLAGVGNTVQVAEIAKPVPIVGKGSFGKCRYIEDWLIIMMTNPCSTFWKKT